MRTRTRRRPRMSSIRPYQNGDQIAFIICLPASLAKRRPEGTIEAKCSQCGQVVVIAPSSQKIMRETGALIECTGCVPEGDLEMVHPDAATLARELVSCKG